MDYSPFVTNFGFVGIGAAVFLAMKFATDKGYLANRFSINIDEKLPILIQKLKKEQILVASDFAYQKLYDFAIESGEIELSIDRDKMLEDTNTIAFTGSKYQRYTKKCASDSAIVLSSEQAVRQFSYDIACYDGLGPELLIGSCLGTLKVIE